MNDYNLQDWQRILFGELPSSFLLEVLGRTVVMFLVIFVALRATGKRTVRQLSVIELVLIIGLGSAAGDPMFYHDVGLLPALLVFTVVILSYRLLTKLAARSIKIETMLEGKSICLIEEGRFSIDNFDKEELGQDEFFMELRIKGVEHLGQVRNGYIETNGQMSLYFYEDEDVKYGMPIRLELFAQRTKIITEDGKYACSFCGTVHDWRADATLHHCTHCNRVEWVKALKTRRIS